MGRQKGRVEKLDVWLRRNNIDSSSDVIALYATLGDTEKTTLIKRWSEDAIEEKSVDELASEIEREAQIYCNTATLIVTFRVTIEDADEYESRASCTIKKIPEDVEDALTTATNDFRFVDPKKLENASVETQSMMYLIEMQARQIMIQNQFQQQFYASMQQPQLQLMHRQMARITVLEDRLEKLTDDRIRERAEVLETLNDQNQSLLGDNTTAIANILKLAGPSLIEAAVKSVPEDTLMKLVSMFGQMGTSNNVLEPEGGSNA